MGVRTVNPNVRPDLEALKVLAQRVTSDAPKAEIGSAVFNKWYTETMQAELDVFAALPDLIAHIERLEGLVERASQITPLSYVNWHEAARATLSQGTSND